MNTNYQTEPLSPSAVQGLKLLWNVCEPQLLRMLATTLQTERSGSAAVFEDGSNVAHPAPEGQLLRALRRGLEGDFSTYDASLAKLGATWSRANVDLQLWHDATAALREEMLHNLIVAYGADASRVESSINALHRITERTNQVLTNEYLQEGRNARVAQRELGDQTVRRLTQHSASDRKRLEESQYRSRELEVLNASISESSRLKNQFLANMSHELRTPLNSVIGFSELLYDGDVAKDSAQQREFLGYILNGGRHLLGLVNEILDLAKVESGTMYFQPEAVDLGQLVAEVCDLVQPLAMPKNIHFECSVDSKLERLTLDPVRLRQVLYNYVSNAIKFSALGSTVHIRARMEKVDTLRLEVVDSGVGISKPDVNRLFVEFQQLDAGIGKSHAGTGLGLALTKRIVEAQGGCVGVQSTLGQGSTFFAVLPCRVRKGVVTARYQTLPKTQARPVLVVDDDDRHRLILGKVLRDAGYKVETATTGAAALGLCTAVQFGAITLAIVLPDTTGLDVLHGLRSSGLNQATPVVIVGVAQDREIVGGFLVHDYLRKPILGPELLASLVQAGVYPEAAGVILVVDDDPPSRTLMEASLGSLGYRVLCSEDGKDALEVAQRVRPRAVILDLLMPTLDGFEFLTRFRSLPQNRNVPVIAWTSKDLTAEDRRRLVALSQGVFRKGDGLPKALIHELESVLGASRRASQDPPTSDADPDGIRA